MAKPHDTASPWTVRVVPARKGARESGLYLRARRSRADGRREDRRVATHTTDPAEAERLRAALERDLNAGDRPRTILDVIDRRLSDLEADPHKSESSVWTFRRARRRFAELLGPLPVEDVDRSALLGARDALLRADPPLRPATVKGFMAAAAASWRWCEERGLVEGPWPRLPKIKPGERRKRPFTDAEVREVFTWIEDYQGGVWLPVFAVLVDTGRRVSEVVRLQGRDVQRDLLTVTIRAKGNRTEVVPVPAETMALVPEVPPTAYVFQSRGRGAKGPPQPDKHVGRGAVLRVLRKAVVAVGIPDGERLDLHSLRRAFVASAERAGVATDVGRRVTGHRTRAMWDHYQAEAVSDDLHAAVAQVRARRFGGDEGSGGASPNASPASPSKAKAPEGPNPQGLEELAVGLEPTASALRMPCSTN